MDEEKSVLGLPPNVAAALSYVAGFVSGIIFYVLEKENRFVRFHAMQSIFLSVTFIVLSIIVGLVPFMRFMLYAVLQMGALVCWVIAIIKAAQSQYFKFPVIGDWAEKQL